MRAKKLIVLRYTSIILHSKMLKLLHWITKEFFRIIKGESRKNSMIDGSRISRKGTSKMTSSFSFLLNTAIPQRACVVLMALLLYLSYNIVKLS